MSWDQLEQTLLSLNDADNDRRHQAEETIKQLQTNPDMAVVLLIQVLRQSANPQARETAAVLFRRVCFNLEEPLWKKASSPVRVQCRTELLGAMEVETVDKVRRKICDAVVEIARGTLREGADADEPWPELLPTLFRLTQMPESRHRTSSLHIFSNLPSIFGKQLPHYLHVIKDILEKAISEQEPDPEVRVGAMHAAIGFVLFLDTAAERNVFQPLLPAMLQLLAVCLTTGSAKGIDVLQSFIEVAENSPSFLKPILQQVVQGMTEIAGNVQIDDECRRLAIEVVCTYVEQKPAACRKQGYFANTVPVALAMMTELEEDEDWDNQDDLDDDFDDNNSTIGEQIIDRLACALGGNYVFPVAFQHILQMIQSPDWKFRHAALMAISAIGEGCRKPMEAKLAEIVHGVLPYLADPHPRVRYAACNALGQMATDFAPGFQEVFHSSVIPALLACTDDANPRVQAHGAAALVNFTEVAPKSLLAPYLDAIFTKLLQLLSSTRRIVLEQAVTTIATVADTSEDMFVKYYDTFIPQLINIMVHAQADKSHRLLRGKTIECISLIGLAVGSAKFRDDALRVMEVLMKTPAEEMEADDPQVSYMLAAWARMCKILGKDFIPYLPTVMPPLLHSANIKPDFAIMDPDENTDNLDPAEGWEFVVLDSQRVGIKTSILEEKCTACEMIVCYARELKGGFAPYVEEVLKIMVPLLKFYFHDGVRLAAAACMGPLLQCAIDGGMGAEFVHNSWNFMLNEYLPMLKDEPDATMVMELMSNFRSAIDAAGPNSCTPEQQVRFADAFIEQLSLADQRINERHDQRKDHEEYDDEMEEGLEEADVTDELIVKEIAEAVHSLFVTHKANLMPLFERMLPALNKMLEPSRPYNDRQWALCMFDDCIEHAGPVAFNYQQYYLQAMVEYLRAQEAEVRHAAAYGIGVAAQFGGPAFHQACQTAFPLLVEMIQAPDSREEDNVHATENAISAVGKMCQFVPAMDSVLPQWLSWLPIVNDTEESVQCNTLLCNLIESNNALVVRPEHMQHIGKVLATVVATDLVKDEHDLNGRVVRLLHQLATHSPDSLNSLDDTLKQKLHQVLAA